MHDSYSKNDSGMCNHENEPMTQLLNMMTLDSKVSLLAKLSSKKSRNYYPGSNRFF